MQRKLRRLWTRIKHSENRFRMFTCFVFVAVLDLKEFVVDYL
jgi:hypothetical protein